jgi:protoporphyrinogen IX oxidase
LLAMARRLYRFAGLLMIPALVLGAWLWLGYGVHGAWLWAKLGLVLVVIGYHHACGSMLRGFEARRAAHSARWYRVFNEVSVLMFAAIVVLVVVKPF